MNSEIITNRELDCALKNFYVALKKKMILLRLTQLAV
jgi:hypothetical protein